MAALVPVLPPRSGRRRGPVPRVVEGTHLAGSGVRYADDPDDGGPQVQVAGAAEEGGVAEREDPAVGSSQPVALPARRGRHAHDRLHGGIAADAAVERRVTEGEDAAVGGDEPVALPGRRGGHADDGLVERGAARGAEEGRVAEGEDAAVGGDEPVALPRRRGCGADDGLVELEVAGRAEQWDAEVEDTAVGGDQPVPTPQGAGDDRHDGLVELQAPRRAQERHVEGEDAAVGPRHPVAVAERRRRHAHDRLVQCADAALERRVAVGEDAAVGGSEPVAPRDVTGILGARLPDDLPGAAGHATGGPGYRCRRRGERGCSHDESHERPAQAAAQRSPRRGHAPDLISGSASSRRGASTCWRRSGQLRGLAGEFGVVGVRAFHELRDPTPGTAPRPEGRADTRVGKQPCPRGPGGVDTCQAALVHCGVGVLQVKPDLEDGPLDRRPASGHQLHLEMDGRLPVPELDQP